MTDTTDTNPTDATDCGPASAASAGWPKAPAARARWENFCHYYVASLNPADAARRAGFAPKYAKIYAHGLLRKPAVAARVRELRAEQYARMQREEDAALRVWLVFLAASARDPRTHRQLARIVGTHPAVIRRFAETMPDAVSRAAVEAITGRPADAADSPEPAPESEPQTRAGAPRRQVEVVSSVEVEERFPRPACLGPEPAPRARRDRSTRPPTRPRRPDQETMHRAVRVVRAVDRAVDPAPAPAPAPAAPPAPVRPAAPVATPVAADDGWF